MLALYVKKLLLYYNFVSGIFSISSHNLGPCLGSHPSHLSPHGLWVVGGEELIEPSALDVENHGCNRSEPHEHGHQAQNVVHLIIHHH